MPTMAMIDGAAVDLEDACAVARALRAAEVKIAVSGNVVMTRFGNGNEVRFSHANSAALTSLIARYEGLCAQATGGRRTRFAKRVTFLR